MCASDAALFHVLIAVNVGVGKLAAFHEKYFHAKQHHGYAHQCYYHNYELHFCFFKILCKYKKGL